MLKQRIITALLMAAVFFCSLLILPSFAFVVLMIVLLLFSAWEWANLAYIHRPMHRFAYMVATVALLFTVFLADGSFRVTVNTEVVRYILLISVSWWALSLLWIQGYPSSAVLWGNRWVLAPMGWLVLIPCWMAFLYLHSLDNGNWLILLVVITVATADTGAYFSGKMLGKHPLAATVSPGKSWEGFWGGLFACALLALIVAWMVDFSRWLQLLVIILLVALASVIGDLVESMVKRHRAVKDSGSILPGHGGVLDRIDGLTAAVPVFALTIMSSDWNI